MNDADGENQTYLSHLQARDIKPAGLAWKGTNLNVFLQATAQSTR